MLGPFRDTNAIRPGGRLTVKELRSRLLGFLLLLVGARPWLVSIPTLISDAFDFADRVSLDASALGEPLAFVFVDGILRGTLPAEGRVLAGAGGWTVVACALLIVLVVDGSLGPFGANATRPGRRMVAPSVPRDLT